MKYLKSCLPKGNFLDTAILLISISFIKIGFILMKLVSSDFIIILSVFIYGFNFYFI